MIFITHKTQWHREHLKQQVDRKSTRLNSSHGYISYAVFCLKKKKSELHADRALLHLLEAESENAFLEAALSDLLRHEDRGGPSRAAVLDLLYAASGHAALLACG